jgi:hypothetical protein
MTPLETVDAYPLTWPPAWRRTPYSHRKAAPFHKIVTRASATPGATYKQKDRLSVGEASGLLRAELRRLWATRVTVSSNLRLRSDGQPYADQRKMLDDPGVAVYFTLKGAPRVLACDKWNSVADNLAAIAHHIEALRAVDRYGVGFLEQAFAGYTALPPAVGHDWRQTLGFGASELVSPAVVEARFRDRAKRAHPDAGGDPHEMARLNAARDVALAELNA